jgi:uncharacterized protein
MTESDNRQTIIGDSSPLISLAIVKQLDLLPRLYQKVVVPQAVWEEITIDVDLPGAMEVRSLTWLHIEHADPKALPPLMILVDRGEAEAIALAMNHPGCTLLLDDAQARRVAERFGVSRIGTLGVLRRAKKAGLIATVRPFIEQLRINGIYMSQALVDAILRDVGES